MKVTLLSHTPNPEKLAATAARLCYSDLGIDQVADGLDEEQAHKFIAHLMSLGHESPLEHCTFTFGVEGVSRALLAQLTRHRIASYSVKSQRYVNEAQFEYVVPPAIERDEQAKALFIQTMEQLQQRYEQLGEILKKNHIKDGQTPGAAQKLANEDARFVLPNACTTQLMMTFNTRSLFNLFHQRCCMRAQWEIREMAERMLQLVREVAPTLFRYAGPSCVRGNCPEGKMSCGKLKEQREKYKC